MNCITLTIPLSPKYPEYFDFIFTEQKIQYLEILASSSLQTLEYIIIEFIIYRDTMKQLINYNSILPYTCYQYDKYPNEPSAGLEISCKGYSPYQQKRANGIYSLIIPATPSQYQKKIVISFNMQLANIQFSMKARGKFASSHFEICPFDCNMDQSTPLNCMKGTCICPDGKIDDDCSLSALPISTISKTLLLNKNSITYAYFKPTQQIEKQSDAPKIKILFSLKNGTPQAVLFLNLGNQTSNKIVPTELSNKVSFTLSKGTFSLSLDPWTQYDSNLNYLSSIFGLTIIGEETNSVDIRIIEEDNLNKYFNTICVFAGIISGILIIWILSLIIKKNVKNNFINNSNLTYQQQNIQQSFHLRKTDHNHKLTLEIMDKYMPTISFSEIDKQEKERGKLLAESCLVCLGEFKASELCRQVICFHYFHKDCIEQWFKKKESCPCCRADLSQKVLVKEKILEDKAKIKNFNKIKSTDLGTAHLVQQSTLRMNTTQMPTNENDLQYQSTESHLQILRNPLHLHTLNNEHQDFERIFHVEIVSVQP